MLEPIAIVGLGAVLPGAFDLQQFWANLHGMVDCSREVPPGRWTLPPEVAHQYPSSADQVASKRACFVEGFQFDPSGFELDWSRLGELDPLYQMALHAARAAFYDGRGQDVDRARIGVILASIALPTEGSSQITWRRYANLLKQRFAERHGKPFTAEPAGRPGRYNRQVTGLPAGLVAKGLGLGGGTYTLDAACASSLYSLKLACDELRSGRADAMLAGGVSRPDSLYTQMGFTALGALSPTGRCSPFDVKGDGLVVGEGAGVLLLKRLSDAENAGDRIYGLIRSIGLSNDIGGSLLAPDQEGQLRAMRAAYEGAGWSPEDVQLIECHGTGTPMGDRVEVSSLRELWNGMRWEEGQVGIGSVKSQIGHLLTGAGAAGMMKVLLGMQNETLPPSINFTAPNPNIPLPGSPFRVQDRPEPWKAPDTRKAAVSAFGFGGINAHVLVEEYRPQRRSWSVPELAPEPVAIVGMAAQVGRAKDFDSWMRSVLAGESLIELPGPERWNGLPGAPAGAYVEQYAMPVGKFKLPPRDIPSVLPQQTLMLAVAGAAAEDAKLAREQRKPRLGALIGISLDMDTTDFHLRWALPDALERWCRELDVDLDAVATARELEHLRSDASLPLDATRTLGALGSIVASRVARELNAGGPSFAISAEEASGLKALEVALRALRSGELDQAIVGAVDLTGDPRNVENATRPLAECRPFDADSQGTALGEGAVALVLKRLKDCTANDKVYGVIRGYGAATGGGVDQPTLSQDAHAMASVRAYQDCGLHPSQVTLLEASGCGVPEEDFEELAFFKAWFGQGPQACALTSLASQSGLMGAATGLLQVAKAAACLYRKVLPPVVGYRRGRGDLSDSRLHVPVAPSSWLRDALHGPRLAAVHNVSRDGNCVHVVLEEHGQGYDWLPELDAGLFVLRGDDLVAEARVLRSHLEKAGCLESLAREWHHSRRGSASGKVAVLVGHQRSALYSVLDHIGSMLDRPCRGQGGLFYSPEPVRTGQVAFVFPGSGSHYAGMGRELALRFPRQVQRLDEESAALASYVAAPWTVPYRSAWNPGWEQESAAQIASDLHRAIFGQVMFGTLASDIIRDFGVQPQAAIGYSLGESASIVAMRAWPDRHEVYSRMENSPLFRTQLGGPCTAVREAFGIPQDAPFQWTVVVLKRSAKEVEPRLSRYPATALLIVSTDSECVVGGDGPQVRELVRELGCDAFFLEGIPAVHCKAVEPVKDEYYRLHLLPTQSQAGLRFYSSYWCKSYEMSTESAARAITEQALYGLDFPRVIRQAYADGVRFFVEMGPGSSCSRMIAQILEGQPHLARSISSKSEPEPVGVLKLLAALIAEGFEGLNLDLLYPAPEPVKAEPKRPEILVRPGELLPAVPPGYVEPGGTGGGAALGTPGTLPTPGPYVTPALGNGPAAWQPTPANTDFEQPQPARSTAAAFPTAASGSYTEQDDDEELFPMPKRGSLQEQLMRTNQATANAHEVFLRFAQEGVAQLARMAEVQSQLAHAAPAGALVPAQRSAAVQAGPPARHVSRETLGVPATPTRYYPFNDHNLEPIIPEHKPCWLDYHQCMEFAIGSIAKVLGPMFQEVDSYPTRVRLPDDPLMLVHRMTEVEGEPGSLGSGRLVTEHDVQPGAWYLDNNRVPVCITVEAGQADLFLSGYLGIDLKTKGLRTYRLLDATVVFHRRLPTVGETIRYDIRIDRFVRQGETYLFFFEFDGTIDGQPMITMRNGCAGFFTDDEIKGSKGIILTDEEMQKAPGAVKNGYRPLTVFNSKESYNDRQVEALRAGDLEACFGPQFANLGLKNPPMLPSGRLKLFDRVLEVDPEGGRFGLGSVKAEADIHPDDWFLTCHFVDDMVMPGTLMYECCAHTLRFLLWRMGWVGEADVVTYEPIVGQPAVLRCRGPVNVHTKKVVYEVEIKEVGYGPEPYVLADAMMYGDGKPIVRFVGMSLRIPGLSQGELERRWGLSQQSLQPVQTVLYDRESIMQFAYGKPSLAFGEPYKVFDEQRKIARLPRPPYAFMDRVVEVNQEPFVLQAGGWIEAHYDIPNPEWYYAANRQPTMAFAVLLEVALQPCGWLAAYCGSALRSDKDLKFRNLGGNATLHKEVYNDAGTLRVRVRMTNVSEAGGMIIENFDMQVLQGDEMVYEGTTYFGFFSEQALANQVGVRDAQRYVETKPGISIALPRYHPLTPEDPQSDPAVPAAMPGGALQMLDEVDVYVDDGGPKGLGFVHGIKRVDPAEWFFQAHFYQDPVMPGSLGLEAFMQLLKVACLQKFPHLAQTHRFECIATGTPHTWAYRGQVIPANKLVETEAYITEVSEGYIKADGFLVVDNKPIYQMTDFAIRMVPV